MRLEPASSVPSDATVRDYDELGRRASEELPGLVAAEDGTAVDAETAGCFEDGEYVRFGGYYRVSVGE